MVSSVLSYPFVFPRPVTQNCFPLWRASHPRLEARQEENQASQQQSGRGVERHASPVTGLSWHRACLGGTGATAALLSSAGARASRASPWAAVTGAGPWCKASDRLCLARPCRQWGNALSRPACRVGEGRNRDQSERSGGGEPRSRVRRRRFRGIPPRAKAASVWPPVV